METRNCQNCKSDFQIVEEDFSFYTKINVPAPTFCPDCRMIRRLSYRNRRKLFKINDFFTNEKIFSLIPPDANTPVVTAEEWYGDTWDALDKGMDIDFTKPFLSQLFELHRQIPQQNLNVTRVINSSYSGNANDLKNCYMVFGAARNEDCMYGESYYGSKDCIDNCDIHDSEFCYMNFCIENCNKTLFSEECIECSEIWFSRNCIGCMNCVGCVNLRNKSYCIFNEQYDKESYDKEIKRLNLNTITGIEELGLKAHEFWKKFPRKYYQGIKNINSSGPYVTQSKNVNNSYLVSNAENIKYSQNIFQPPNKDCYDISVWGDGSELAYEYSSCGSGIYNSKFLIDCWPNIRNTEYSLHCNSSSNLFGCVGLKNQEYCILNKKYLREDYEVMVGRIKKHMDDMPYVDHIGLVYKYGEFFPVEFSWYGYNNTMVQEYFPLTKEEAEKLGYPWYEVKKGEYNIDIKSNNLPQSSTEISDEIIHKIISCNKCGDAYKFQPEEIIFLKRENLPLPRNCPECRYQMRLVNRLSPKLYPGRCMKEGCNNEFMTGYNPINKDIVYCEPCYQQVVI